MRTAELGGTGNHVAAASNFAHRPGGGSFSRLRAFAQRYNFKFYGEDEGLKNLAVQAVLQDRAGFLWAGTQNGLYRYDGNRFTAFTRATACPGRASNRCTKRPTERCGWAPIAAWRAARRPLRIRCPERREP